MNQLKTTAIILSRVDYGEADRILTVLTPDAGKLALMAKGVRRVKSKLAGGVELFSTSEITYIQGRGSVSTLISARLIKYYKHITTDINRTMLGYELIKLLNKVTEDEPEVEYYDMLEKSFEALDDATIPLEIVRTWFSAQLLRQAGLAPNLVTDTKGDKLAAGLRYEFNYEDTAFTPVEAGLFGQNEIKYLRLLFSASTPALLAKVENVDVLNQACGALVITQRQLHLRI